MAITESHYTCKLITNYIAFLLYIISLHHSPTLPPFPLSLLSVSLQFPLNIATISRLRMPISVSHVPINKHKAFGVCPRPLETRVMWPQMSAGEWSPAIVWVWVTPTLSLYPTQTTCDIVQCAPAELLGGSGMQARYSVDISDIMDP